MDIQTLVQGFAKHIRELKASDYKESSVRSHYIDPFWRLLGWDVNNEEQRAPQDVEVLIEPSMEAAEDDGLRAREPDYLFRLNGFPRFVVEAKKPAVDLDTDKRAIFQAKRYAWNATIPFAILTDFEQFRLYDATLKPVLSEPKRGLVREFQIDFQDYPGQWDEFLANFGREAVAGGALERLRARIKRVGPTRRLRTVDRMLYPLKGEEPVDKAFLGYLEQHRKHLARAIYDDNKKSFPEADTHHGAARLTEAVQRIIDRMVFMRVCEDRGITKWGKLQEMLDRVSQEGGNFYEALCDEFHDLDREYNGYLYKPHFSEELKFSDDVLADFVRTLYPPDGPWDFSAISDDILGIVYERFLGNVVTVKRGHAVIEEKPEVRHAGGVYYTPRFVVDTIIRRVIGPQIQGKKPTEVLDIKVLDPACGSGSFLVAAFQYLIDHCLAAIAADPSLAKVPATPRARKKHKEIAFQDKNGRWHLAPDFRAAILTNCIHGVDIDQQAVEVTVMSLYLKMLEGKLPQNWQRDWVENQLLPPLDNNIRCGNSLIDHPDFDRYVNNELGGLFPDDDDVRFRINRFDWTSKTRGFGRILDDQAAKERRRKGFDCIIGNPPYIRVQELNKWAPDECAFYKWRYQSAKKGNYDIYVVFVERCLEFLAPNGLLGFIIPHKFWTAKYGAGLREVLSRGRHIRSVIDFTDQQVFEGATTYTAIHVLQAQLNTGDVAVAVVSDLTDGEVQCRLIDEPLRADGPGFVKYEAVHPKDEQPWVFQKRSDADWCANLAAAHPPLSDVASEIFVGLRTSADTVFVFEEWRDEGKLTHVRSVELDRSIGIEQEILRPVVRSGEIGRHWAKPTARVLFPYEIRDGRAVLFPPAVMAQRFPRAWSYLQENETLLRGRESGKFDHHEWYGLMRKNLERWQGPKVMVPYMVTQLSAFLDSTGDYYFVNVTTGGFGIRSNKVDLSYLAGLLSSALLDRWFKCQAGRFHSGYFGANKQYVERIPIAVPKSTAERKLADQIASLVSQVTGANAKLENKRLSDRERQSLEGEVESLERRIDEAVFQLYGVEGLPADEPTAERPGTVALTDKSSEQKAEAARILAEVEAQLAPDIKAELDRIEKLDQEALLDAVTPIMRPKQARRLASLNRKAQDEGLTDGEERERDELLHVYEKSMVIRATALAELHKRGVDVSELIAP
jgi:type I restriction-modification system DNA methylase subunit